ncbi:hypothetical protein PC9H_005451 [Pleurotus ostreatus]|uniref:Uncharacterized protein n=1 Tax=Pleurotus ostreatus TaxID=5322 RepID=A0A8H6ZWH7_PLEOS|nr:uncharacterized protein PC9H_005451 [Pleurotus ostreatus]KAF7433497.1 hypothetical protein PC9H_005451 [Pleurotus ostreatus]
MSNPTGPTPSYTSPDVLKHMEKDLVKAGKTEESSVKHTMKDLKSLEKSTSKAAKSADKAEHHVAKNQDKELKTAKAVSKATHNHDVARDNLQKADRDLQLKQQHALKLEQELEARKIRVEAAVKSQEIHNQEREEKLANVKAQLAATTSTKV